jgi:hypothetical protein
LSEQTVGIEDPRMTGHLDTQFKKRGMRMRVEDAASSVWQARF